MSRPDSAEPRRTSQLSSYFSKKLRTLVSRLPVEYSGKEPALGSGLLLGKDLGMERCLLLGKELDKKLSSMLAK